VNLSVLAILDLSQIKDSRHEKMPKVGNVHILYALDIVAYENKPGPNSMITGKITGNFLKFSSSCDIKYFPFTDWFLTPTHA